ncbi:hypothetical protein [Actinosynnema sp. NPDC020468]|uniref:hypothetical protein n=1 Tax=Actinosynnema sp. NPDC020468 TaxID=3154488 RepID=UPI0033FA3A47
MSRRWWGILVLAFGFGAAVVGVVVSAEPEPLAGRALAAPGGYTPPLTESAAKSLANDLTSGDLTRVRTALAVPVDQPLDDGAVTGLKALAPVLFDVGTFHDDANGTARITAEVGGRPWTVRLVSDAGRWKVSGTEPVR